MKKFLAITAILGTLFLTSCNKEVTYDSESWKEIISPDCMSFFDGCNSCGRLDNGEIICTKMFCEVYEEPYCTDDENNENIETSGDTENQTGDISMAKMKIVEGQTEEEVQNMIENACSNAGGNLVDGACVLEDGSKIMF